MALMPGVYIVEHKCLAGDAQIFDHGTGKYWSVAELFARGMAPLVSALAPDGRLVRAQAKVPVLASVRAIYRITTLGGRSLRVSGNHPIWTARGWVTADQVGESDWVATPRHLESPHVGADLSDEEVRLLGYMIGDGSYSNVSFTKSDETVLADVMRCAATMGEDVAVKRPIDRAPYLKFSQVGPVGALLDRAGFARSTLSDTKRLPLHLGLSDRQTGQLVGALWNTDGCVDTATTSSGSKKLRIIYTSVSRALCVDIQHALQRLGVVSNVRTTSVEYRGERRPVSTVQVVSRAAKRLFLSLAREGVIPLLRSHASIDDAAAAIPSSHQGDDNRMQPSLDEHVWWDRVEAVVVEAEEQTYDLEVPGPHTFVVDGIITHNTTSQDIGEGSPYWKRLAIDAQVSKYLVGGRALGHEPIGVLYDVIKKPALRPLTATPADERKYTEEKSRACKECKKKSPSPGPHLEEVKNDDGSVRQVACVEGRIVTDPGGRLYANQRDRDETPDEFHDRILEDIKKDPFKYFQRGTIVRLEGEELDAARDTWELAKQIRESQLKNRWPRNPDACDAYGSFCQYFRVCSGEISLDDDLHFRNADAVNEELTSATIAKRRLPLVTTSSQKAYRSCQRKYFYAYERRRRSVKETAALRFGTLMHLALEVWWKTVDVRAAIAAMAGESDPFELAKAGALMRGYHAMWADEALNVLAVEEEFVAPLVNPDTGRESETWQRGGKIDAICEVPATTAVAAA